MTGSRTPTTETSDAQLARARQHLADLGTRLNIDGTTGEYSSAPIFDLARPGLDYFRAFGESHARLRGTSFDFESDIARRYNAEREITFGRIRADAERFANLFTEMTDTDVDFRNSAGSLFDYWQGRAADEAKGRMAGFLTSAGSVWGAVQRFADALLAACAAAERVVLDKATAVLDLAVTTIEGLTATDVALLVDLATAAGASALSDTQLVSAAELLGLAMPPEVCRTNPVVFTGLRNTARDRLDDLFVPDYDTRYAAFRKACTTAATGLDAAWENVATALGELSAFSPDTFATSNSPATPVPVPTQHHTPTPVTSAQAPTPGPAAPTPASTPVTSPAPTNASPATPPPSPPVSPTPPASPGPLTAPVPTAPAPTAPAPIAPPGVTATPGNSPDAPPNNPSGGSSDSAVGAPAGDAARSGASPVGSPDPNSQSARPDPEQAPAQTQPAATGYAYPPPGLAPAGGEGDHERKVPLKGKPVPQPPVPAAPDGIIGDEDDPAHYNEAQQLGGYLAPVERPAIEEKVEERKEPTQTAWRLNKDGELEAVEIPATPQKKV